MKAERGASWVGSPTFRAVGAMVLLVAMTGALFMIDADGFYLWAKALHVIAVIAWMAGMLYLPRLFVYHAQVEKGGERSEMLKVMERRLLRAIINPAMIVTWMFGLWLAWKGFAFSGGWLHVKIGAVLALSGLHGYFSRTVREFAQDRHDRSARHWRILNEAVTVLMIVVVVLVIVKPF